MSAGNFRNCFLSLLGKINPDSLFKNSPPSVLLRCIAILLLSCTAVLFAYSLFFRSWQDWDLNSFIYLGSRLLHGELLYLKDFETKLPFLQYIFVVPAVLGGIGSWRIITFLLSSVFALAGSFILARDYLECERNSSWKLLDISLLLTGFFLSLLYSLPRSLCAHIEMVSAAAGYLSFALLMANRKLLLNQFGLFMSGVFLAFAALIRPNFVYLIVVYVFYVLLAGDSGTPLCSRLRKIVVLLAGFAGLILLSFVPYFFSFQSFSALVHGLWAIASFPLEISFSEMYSLQKEIGLFPVLTYASCLGVGFFLMFKRPDDTVAGLSRNWGIMSILCIVLLNYSFVTTHFYGHNIIMLVPYAVPLVFLLILSLDRTKTTRLLLYAYLLVVAIHPLQFSWNCVRNVLEGKKFNASINHRMVNDKLLSFLKKQKNLGHSFYVLDNVLYHYLLGEPRNGDGHPFMLHCIFQHKKIGPFPEIPLYSEEVRQNPCLALLQSGKDIIVDRSRLGDECLTEMSHVYKLQYLNGLQQFRIYVKRTVN